VTALARDGDRVQLLSAEPETVLRELFRRGVALSDLEVAGADLEEAFLALTARGTGRP
jgi:ABC-2 type transport system ATP-binding protein